MIIHHLVGKLTRLRIEQFRTPKAISRLRDGADWIGLLSGANNVTPSGVIMSWALLPWALAYLYFMWWRPAHHLEQVL